MDDSINKSIDGFLVEGSNQAGVEVPGGDIDDQIGQGLDIDIQSFGEFSLKLRVKIEIIYVTSRVNPSERGRLIFLNGLRVDILNNFDGVIELLDGVLIASAVK